MPIYEYQCQKCGHHHEALQKISDPQLRKCPECGRDALKRLVSAVRFRLAGSGWYETDFKADHEAKRNLHEKGDKEPAPAETKPDAAAAPAADAASKKADSPAKPDGGSAPSGDAARGKSRTIVPKPVAKTAARRLPTATRKPARTPPQRGRR